MVEDTEVSSEYRKSLGQSLALTFSVIEKLKMACNSQMRDTDSLNTLQHDLIFDTMKLTKSKNAFKNEFSDKNEALAAEVEKLQMADKNPFINKYEQQRYKNVVEWDRLRHTLLNIPELNLAEIADIIGDGKCGISDAGVEQINELLWDGENVQSVDKLLVDAEQKQELSEALAESDKQKFRLVQLHDKYYQRKIAGLKESDRKWTSELNKIKQFVSNEVAKVKSDLQEKLQAEKDEDFVDYGVGEAETEGAGDEDDAEDEYADGEGMDEDDADGEGEGEGAGEGECEGEREGEGEDEKDGEGEVDGDEEDDVEMSETAVPLESGETASKNSPPPTPIDTTVDAEMIGINEIEE